MRYFTASARLANKIFENFPDELLFKIIFEVEDTAQNLLKIASVSKRWHAIINDNEMLKNILAKIPDEQLYKLIEKNCKNGSIRNVTILLLDPRVGINKKYQEGSTLLHFTCSGYSGLSCGITIDLVKFLLTKGAATNITNDRGWLPLHFAARQFDSQICQLLLQHSPELQININSPLHRVSIVDIAEILISHGASIEASTYGRTPLLEAISSDHIDMVRCLIRHHANVNTIDNLLLDHKTALHLAASKGLLEIVKLLVENGANLSATIILDNNPTTPKELALKKYHSEVNDIEKEKLATVAEYLEHAEQILRSLNTNDKFLFETILDISAHKEIKSLAFVCNRWQELTQNQPVLKNILKNFSDEKLLELLEKNCSIDSVKCIAILLLDERTAINPSNILLSHPIWSTLANRVPTVLHNVAANGALEIVKFLVNNGANLNATMCCNGSLLTPKEMASKEKDLIVNDPVKLEKITAVIQYLENIEKKLTALYAVRENILREIDRLEASYFFKDKEKIAALEISLEKAWHDIYPQIFEENLSLNELNYLLLNNEKSGISVTQALAIPSKSIASLCKFFGIMNRNSPIDCEQNAAKALDSLQY